jgi:hypothetical protein
MRWVGHVARMWSKEFIFFCDAKLKERAFETFMEELMLNVKSVDWIKLAQCRGGLTGFVK